jgi:hypothetical protein
MRALLMIFTLMLIFLLGFIFGRLSACAQVHSHHLQTINKGYILAQIPMPCC